MKKLFFAVLMAMTMTAPVAAQDAASADVEIELNKLEQVEDACRVYMVFRTLGGVPLTRATLDLVLFDTDGVILKRLAYEAGPLESEKTVVKLFDSTQTDCARVGEVLLNAVTACETPEGTTENCIARMATSSRAEASFTL